MKQVVAVRKDLDMSTGKVAAQVAHGSMWAYHMADLPVQEAWENEHERIAVVSIDSKDEISDLAKAADTEGVPFAFVNDMGFTEVDELTTTAIGIGPHTDDRVDSVTGHLPLY